MIKAWIKAVLILPGTVLIVVPSLILWGLSGTGLATAGLLLVDEVP